MKKIFIFIVNIYCFLPYHFYQCVLYVPRIIASKITKDPNIKSNKNDFWAFIILCLFIFFLIFFFKYNTANNSGWKSLEKHYAMINPDIYQDNEYTLTLLKNGSNTNRGYHYSIKMKLVDSGFYFSSPTFYRKSHSKSHNPIIPYFIYLFSFHGKK